MRSQLVTSFVSCHSICYDTCNFLWYLDEVPVGKVGVACRCSVLIPPIELAHVQVLERGGWMCGGISAISAWHRPLVAFDPKYSTRRSRHTRAQLIDARFYGVKRRSTTRRRKPGPGDHLHHPLAVRSGVPG